MVHAAHALAVLCYAGAAALAATPFARPVAAPVRGVVSLLGAGVATHALALLAVGLSQGQAPLTGLGPALSFAGMVLALNLLVVEAAAREVTMTLAAGPLAGLCTAAALAIGFRPVLSAQGARALWLDSHIALSFLGIGALATAAAAGAMYLVERRQLKARRFGALFRFFPPLETLDRVNHVAAVTGWLVLTLGVVLAVTYSAQYEAVAAHKLVWAGAAWLGATALALGFLAQLFGLLLVVAGHAAMAFGLGLSLLELEPALVAHPLGTATAQVEQAGDHQDGDDDDDYGRHLILRLTSKRTSGHRKTARSNEITASMSSTFLKYLWSAATKMPITM
jgi:ABC-type uncharacterized transport system permease subunit